MDVCLILDNPETPKHPVLGTVLHELSARHTVRLLDVRTLTGDETIAREQALPLADLYLLKSHTLQALEVARHLEQRGALVVNSWASSTACRDRVLMAQRMEEARLPYPHTWSVDSLESLRRQDRLLSTLKFPLVVKSRYSRRGDLVDKVRDVERLHALAERRSEEPVILQEFVDGGGWDLKLWVIDRHIFAARRRTPLEANAPRDDIAIRAETVPSDWRSMTFEIGRIFGLRLYGVDLLVNERGPLVVDVNSFPGFRGVAGAARALIALVEGLLEERQVAVCPPS